MLSGRRNRAIRWVDWRSPKRLFVRLSPEELAQAIEAKIRRGLMFNLRFVHGTRDGEPAPENDALMFTVPVEFPDDTGTVRRYQVGVKYSPASHSGEVVTFH